MKTTRYIVGGLCIVLLLGAYFFIQQAKAPSANTFTGEVHTQNLTNPDSDGSFTSGDHLKVEYFVKNPSELQKLLLNWKKQYSDRFGFKEGSLLVNGKPMEAGSIEIPAGDAPVHISYEVIAQSNTGNPAELIALETSTVETPTETNQTTPALTGCPVGELIHNSDLPLILQGNGLAGVTTMQLGTLTLTPNKKAESTLWFNLPGKSLSDGTHTVTLTSGTGTTQTTCAITTKVYTTPVATNITPATIQQGNAMRIMLQGELFDQATKLSLTNEQLTVEVPMELYDPKVLSFITPETLPAGEYQLMFTTTTAETHISPRVTLMVSST